MKLGVKTGGISDKGRRGRAFDKIWKPQSFRSDEALASKRDSGRGWMEGKEVRASSNEKDETVEG
jgi:hypothetical protein